MGAFCSCFHVSDAQDNAPSNSSGGNGCLCPRCFVRRLLDKHGNLFKKRQIRVVTPRNQPRSLPNAGVSTSDVTDSDDGMKLHSDSVPVQFRIQFEEGRIEEQSPSPSAQTEVFTAHCPSSNDEDECPTCFEDYTPENPKITANCSHHYHLPCILEWFEKSRRNNCPACDKEMWFEPLRSYEAASTARIW